MGDRDHNAAPIQGPLSRATKYLQDNHLIGSIKSRYDKYERCVTLRSSDIFAQLVTLYTPQFRMHWPLFKTFMEAYLPPGNTTAWDYAARVYISGWFHDLYASNREAVKKSLLLAYNEHYMHERLCCSSTYDEFLTRLNAAIRPTHIQGMPLDTLFIPLIADNIDWNHPTSNWFGITNFTMDYDCMLGLINIIKHSRIWGMSRLVTNNTGRPSWLFDWHSNKRCCAWFPAEGNYNSDDVSLAYEIGVACTPHLGPFDLDDWQPFPGGNIKPSGYERVTERRFFGGYEVRTLEVKTYDYFNAPPSRINRKRKAGLKQKDKAKSSGDQEPSASADTESTQVEVVQETPYFQISDWTYYDKLRAPKVWHPHFEYANFS